MDLAEETKLNSMKLSSQKHKDLNNIILNNSVGRIKPKSKELPLEQRVGAIMKKSRSNEEYDISSTIATKHKFEAELKLLNPAYNYTQGKHTVLNNHVFIIYVDLGEDIILM